MYFLLIKIGYTHGIYWIESKKNTLAFQKKLNPFCDSIGWFYVAKMKSDQNCFYFTWQTNKGEKSDFAQIPSGDKMETYFAGIRCDFLHNIWFQNADGKMFEISWKQTNIKMYVNYETCGATKLWKFYSIKIGFYEY